MNCFNIKIFFLFFQWRVSSRFLKVNFIYEKCGEHPIFSSVPVYFIPPSYVTANRCVLLKHWEEWVSTDYLPKEWNLQPPREIGSKSQESPDLLILSAASKALASGLEVGKVFLPCPSPGPEPTLPVQGKAKVLFSLSGLFTCSSTDLECSLSFPSSVLVICQVSALTVSRQRSLPSEQHLHPLLSILPLDCVACIAFCNYLFYLESTRI